MGRASARPILMEANMPEDLQMVIDFWHERDKKQLKLQLIRWLIDCHDHELEFVINQLERKE